MNVIALRSFHFRKHKITKDEKTGELAATVEKEIMIDARQEVQVLPDWVKEDELFDLAIGDGTLQEVEFVKQAKPKTLDTNPKVRMGVPKATLADPNQTNQVATVGVSQPVTENNPPVIPLTGQVSAGGDWPKAADKSNNSGLAG